ncbi:MAG: glutamate racemase [Ruminococcaceae bacterium]|nr:glutamate racemase [Oscillospiraceae bacterium]
MQPLTVRSCAPTAEDVKTTAAPVAVFDSGIGGIGVLREIRKLLPHENLLYFGDTAMAPYGERPPEEIRSLVTRHAARLLTSAKALVLACNTATAVAAEALRGAWREIPIIGMEPAIKPALLEKKHKTVLVLATAATLREQKLSRLLKAYQGRATFYTCAAPCLVRLVEEGHLDDEVARREIAALLDPILARISPDAVVLGCTHFPFVAGTISHFLGPSVPLFDGAEGTARELSRRLEAAGICNKSTKRGRLVLTASSPASLAVMQQLL